ncbi:SEA/GATOR complex protein SEA2/WDR24, partial [Phenoliferia sp. Uapishka_3]
MEPKRSSAFSRFTSFPNSLSSGGTSSPSSNSSLPPAQDVLEALASMHLGRARHSSEERVQSTGRAPSLRERRDSDAGRALGAGLGGPGVDSPEPPSPRPHPRLGPGSSGGGGSNFDPASQGAGSNSSNWGLESLPQNASASAWSALHSNNSAFADGSHFFPPGSSFSFEGSQASYSPASVGGASGAPYGIRRLVTQEDPMGSSSWDAYSQSAERRHSFRQQKTRGLKFVLAAERGVIGLAKPKDNPDGTVVVAGKQYLRLLKVPPRDHLPPLDRTSTSVATSSSIASRRSRSRGSPVPLDRRRADSSAERPPEREDIVEVHDLKAGSKLGPAYSFSDVRWGYADTSNKIATAFSNGAVATWDLEREGPSRLELMNQHDRAVNQVLFGGPTGNYLLSAGQDGNIKLWDVRGNRTSNNVLKASSPVQRMAFSPSASQPWTLLAVCTSGTLIRYDLRNLSSGKPSGAITDRFAGHVGAILAMDWRDNYDADDAERREGGWVVTGGMDRTIKIWDFSQPVLQNKPIKTLYSCQPVQDVAWHPSLGTELASSPMPTLGTLLRSGTEDNSGGSSASLDTGSKDRGAGKESLFWKNEIEVWDTRRAFFPKATLKTEEPISAILYNDDETIWATSKTSPTFHQYDVAGDSHALLDNLPRPGAVWSTQGDLWFSAAGPGNDSPTTGGMTAVSEVPTIESPNFRPDVSLACVSDFDFDRETFKLFAEDLLLTGDDFGDICDKNAALSESLQRLDAAQLWHTIKIWLHDQPHAVPDPPPESPPLARAPLEITTAIPPLFDLGSWLLSPTALAPESKHAPKVPTRRSFSNPLGRRSNAHSPVILPSEPLRPGLDAFSEESSNGSDFRLGVRNPSPLPPPPADEMTSSDSEQDRGARIRGTPAANKLSASLSALQTSRNRSNTLSGLSPFTTISQGGDLSEIDDFSLPPTSNSRLQSRAASSSSSGSDSDADGSRNAKIRATKIMARQAQNGGEVHRRASSGASADRKPRMSRDGVLQYDALSRHTSIDRKPINMSRRGSSGFVATKEAPPPPLPSRAPVDCPTQAQLTHKESLAHFEEMKTIVKQQIKSTLQDYADKVRFLINLYLGG